MAAIQYQEYLHDWENNFAKFYSKKISGIKLSHAHQYNIALICSLKPFIRLSSSHWQIIVSFSSKRSGWYSKGLEALFGGLGVDSRSRNLFHGSAFSIKTLEINTLGHREIWSFSQVSFLSQKRAYQRLSKI